MTLDTRSFFVGAAGVLGILLVGFGGGVLMSGVISDGAPRQPNKIERQAVKETRPLAFEATKSVNPPETASPVPDVAPTAIPSPLPKPAPQLVVQAQPVPQAAPPPKPESQPVRQAQPAPQPAPQSNLDPQPVMQAQPAPQPPRTPRRSQVRAHTLGAEKPVALTQPGLEERPSGDLSRREAERLKAKQRREERRKQMADRRREEQMRREEFTSAVQRSRPQQADADDDDNAPIVTRREQPVGLPFFRMFESQSQVPGARSAP
jgi:hypothetical protein